MTTGPFGLSLTQAEWQVIARRLHLSPRALDIVRRLVSGSAEKVVAADLGISRRTVHAHVERVYSKCDVHNRVELVHRVLNARCGEDGDEIADSDAISANEVARWGKPGAPAV